MKTSKIIGKKVLDCNANDIAKVHDIVIDLKSNNINTIFITESGELGLRKINYKVTPDMILKVGDYLLLNIPKSEIASDKSKDIPDVEIVNPSELEDKSKSK